MSFLRPFVKLVTSLLLKQMELCSGPPGNGSSQGLLKVIKCALLIMTTNVNLTQNMELNMNANLLLVT